MNPNAPYNTGALQNMVARVKTYCSHIIPLVFDNTLSYYESLCAFSAKVNELCDAVNAQNLTIAEFAHMVEVEITKFEEYIEGELTPLKERVTTLETDVHDIDHRLSDTERDLTSTITTVRDLVGRVGAIEINDEHMEESISELQTLASTHSGQIMILQNTLTALQSNVNSINALLSEKVNKSDVVNEVQQGNMNPVTSNAVYEVVTGGITPVIADATTTSKGIMQVGDNLRVTDGVVSVPESTPLVKGVVTADNQTSGLALTNGAMRINRNDPLVVDTQTNKLGIKLGANMGVDIDGSLIANIPDATYTQKGLVQTDNQTSGLGLTNGILAVRTESPLYVHSQNNSVGVKLGQGMSTDGNGALVASIPDATYTVKGKVTADNLTSGIALTNGAMSVNKGDTLYVTNQNKLEVKTASISQKGVIAPTLNGALTVTNDGEADVRFATSTLKGVVVLTNSISSNDASHVPTSKAVADNCAIKNIEYLAVRADNADSDGFSQLYKVNSQGVSSNLIPKVPIAGDNNYGVVKVGSSLTAVNGVLQVPHASPSGFGSVMTSATISQGDTLTVPQTGAVYSAIQSAVRQNGIRFIAPTEPSDIQWDNWSGTNAPEMFLAGGNLNANTSVTDVRNAILSPTLYGDWFGSDYADADNGGSGYIYMYFKKYLIDVTSALPVGTVHLNFAEALHRSGASLDYPFVYSSTSEYFETVINNTRYIAYRIKSRISSSNFYKIAIKGQ